MILTAKHHLNNPPDCCLFVKFYQRLRRHARSASAGDFNFLGFFECALAMKTSVAERFDRWGSQCLKLDTFLFFNRSKSGPAVENR